MTTNKHFNNKEHYLTFRKAWSNAVNSNKAKSHLETCDEWLVTEQHQWGHVSEGTGKCRVKGWITGAHVMLYNLLRNKPYDTGFSPVTSASRLNNGHYINHGLYEAYRTLSSMSKDAREMIKHSGSKASIWATKRVMEFLDPFEGTITIKMLSEIEIPTVPAMYSNYGLYRKVAQMIKGRNPEIEVTFEHVNNLFEMVKKEAA